MSNGQYSISKVEYLLAAKFLFAFAAIFSISACAKSLGMPWEKDDFSNVKDLKICKSIAKYYINPPLRMDRTVNGKKQSIISDSTEKRYIINYLHTEIQKSSPSVEELKNKLTELGMQCNQDVCFVDCGNITRHLYHGSKKIKTEHFPIKIHLNLQQGLGSLNPYYQQ